MLVVVASRHDAGARRLVDGWPAAAGLLSCEDLSTAGWRYRVGDPAGGTAVVDGRVVPVREIQGVLTRRPAVLEQELAYVAAPDRAYVAAETNAFLDAWLAALACPVLSRPTPLCLSGPGWRPEQWVRAAAAVGIPVRPRRRRAPAGENGVAAEDAGEPVDVTVVGGELVGGVGGRLGRWTRRLAAVAGVELLGVRFVRGEEGPRFGAATVWPDLEAPVVHAIEAYFLE